MIMRACGLVMSASLLMNQSVYALGENMSPDNTDQTFLTESQEAPISDSTENAEHAAASETDAVTNEAA